MLRTFGTFLRSAQPATAAATFHRRPRGVCYCCAATDGMTGPKAKVGQPAPHWRGKAVLNDEIKEISLDDFKAREPVLVTTRHMCCQQVPAVKHACVATHDACCDGTCS